MPAENFRETEAGKMLARIFNDPLNLDVAVAMSNRREAAMAAYIKPLDEAFKQNRQFQDPNLFDHGTVGKMIGEALLTRGYRWSQNPNDAETIIYSGAKYLEKAMGEKEGRWAVFDRISDNL